MTTSRSPHPRPRREQTTRRPSGACVRPLVAGVLATALLVGAAGPVAADDTSVVDAIVPAGLDLDAVREHVDRTVAAAMDEHEIPGGVFVLVADGGIAIARGYGHTGLDRRTPVDPARTRFDIGSVSKLVTATAVMQQVERGRLDLDQDVTGYLEDVEVPATFAAPVTAAHLLTHTAGFAERFMVGMWASGPGRAEPLAESLARLAPGRIRPPGEAHQYNNYGMALAGHLVEVVSGRTFEEYVHEQVLEPLGMSRTTYGRPTGPDTVDVTPHAALTGPTTALEPEYVNLLPAGGLWTTGEDVAAFMLAHVGGGEHAGTRILEPATVSEMHASRFVPHPDVPGIGYGFFQDHRGGVQHGGGWVGTGAHLYLRPDLGIGLFAAFNHGDGALVAPTLLHDVADRFLPPPPSDNPARAVPAATSSAATDAPSGSYAGTYRWNRHDRTSFASLFSVIEIARVRVVGHADGSLTTSMTPHPYVPETRWVPAEPGVFVDPRTGNVLGFDLDEQGAATGLHVLGAQLFSMERTAWHQSPDAILAALATVVLVLLAAAVGWPLGAARRRWRREGAVAPTTWRRLRRLSGLTAGLAVLFVVGLAAHFAIDMPGVLQAGPGLRLLLWLPLVVAAATAGLTVLLLGVWRRRDGSLAGRLYHSGVLAALLAFLPLLLELRLLGFHY
jgi:CubicO group peptidase (beta-lactamase class C family)